MTSTNARGHRRPAAPDQRIDPDKHLIVEYAATKAAVATIAASSHAESYRHRIRKPRRSDCTSAVMTDRILNFASRRIIAVRCIIGNKAMQSCGGTAPRTR